MKFKKMLKRKMYSTWIAHDKIKDCTIYIFKIPKEKEYHFQVVCHNGMQYASLDDTKPFKSFNEACEIAIECLKNNCNDCSK